MVQAFDAVPKDELETRQRNLLSLRWELSRLGADVRVRKPRNGRWQLRLRNGDWSQTILCAGAEGTYAFVTAEGQLLGAVDDYRHVARILLWMTERKQR